MGIARFIADLRVLHEKAHAGLLGPEELREHDKARDELAKAIITAQNLTVHFGEKPRRSLRVSKAFPVQLELPEGVARALTLDVSASGFAVLLARELVSNSPVPFRMQLPGTGEVRGLARAAVKVRERLSSRVGFEIVSMTDEAAARMEAAVFDEVLVRFGREY